MDSQSSPPITAFLPAAITLMIVGWGGLAAVILTTSPNGGTRWLFFFVSVLALTGTVMPGTAYLNRRFSSIPPATPVVIVRQALWVGIYFPTLAWLQIGRVLSLSLGLLLAIGLIMIEWLLRLREKSQWKP
jgi:hypothetical protein